MMTRNFTISFTVFILFSNNIDTNFLFPWVLKGEKRFVLTLMNYPGKKKQNEIRTNERLRRSLVSRHFLLPYFYNLIKNSLRLFFFFLFCLSYISLKNSEFSLIGFGNKKMNMKKINPEIHQTSTIL